MLLNAFITKKEICTGSSLEKCSRTSGLYTGYVKEPGLSCVVGAPVSCTMGHLQKLTISMRRRRMGKASECVAKQKQKPPNILHNL